MLKRIIVSALILSALLFSVGCTADNAPLLSFSENDATFTAVFPSSNGDVTAECTKTGDCFTLTVVSPERSSGVRVETKADGSCVLCPLVGDGITLSAEAAKRLTSVLGLLSRGGDGSPVIKKADVGSEIIWDDGKLTLGDDGLPMKIEMFGDGGREIALTNYTITEKP